LIVYAKKKGILDIYFNTNAMLLSENMSCSLIGAELTRISISIEGTDPLAFEQERRGAKFDTIMFNIDKLIELREKKNCKHPKVRIQTVRLPNLDLNNYKKFWESHCDEVAVIDYKDAVNRDKTLINDYWACPQLWQRMTIEWNGAIMPCNNDDFRLLSSGNVENKSVFECWHNSIVQDARKMHQAGKSHLISACNGCPWRTTQIKKLLKK